MPMTLEEIEMEARKLSEEDREILAERLLSELVPENQEKIEAAQRREIKRRYQESIAGNAEWFDGEKVFEEAEKILNEKISTQPTGQERVS